MQLAWIRLRRSPLIAVAIFCFTAIIAMVLCGLSKGVRDAQAHYEEIYKTIDVRCTITNLAGDQSDHLMLSSDMVSLFAGRSEGMTDRFPDDLTEWVEDVQITGSTEFTWNGEEFTLTGITSRGAKSALWPENGCTIQWNEGLDDSAFTGDQMICIIPEALAQKLTELELPEDVFPLKIEARYDFQTEYNGELEIGGVYHSEETTTVYCSWNAYAAILRSMGMFASAESLSAVLRDNYKLEEFRLLASQWFAEPTPNAAGRDQINGFYYALDINDSQLVQADMNLRNSMSVNRVAVAAVFIMSTGAGALVGFLLIRNRRREVILMRTMGTPDLRIYASFAAEQLMCAVPGALVGGAYFHWQPISWLMMFVCAYFIGLSLAMLIALRHNLLATIKEDE